MSQALMDYVTARHEAMLCVLEMLAAEHRLSDEYSSALALTDAESKVDAAAARLAEAVDTLPTDRKPVGWNEWTAVAGHLTTARMQFAMVTLRCISLEHAGESADADASAEYADEHLALAARNLAADAAAQKAAKAEAGGRLL